MHYERAALSDMAMFQQPTSVIRRTDENQGTHYIANCPTPASPFPAETDRK